MQGTILLTTLSVLAVSAWAIEVEEFPVTDSEGTLQYFREWAAIHGKTYSSETEFSKRYTIFLANLQKAAAMNAERSNHDSAVFGPTKFSDLTDQEFKNTILRETYDSPRTYQKQQPSKPTRERQIRAAVPDEYDWRSFYTVTAVRDQGDVNTGWAFAGNAALESQCLIEKKPKCEILSVQAALACDGWSDVSWEATACGVKGGTALGFFFWVQNKTGVMTESDYPYCLGHGDCSPCAPPGYDSQVCGGSWPIDPCKKEDSCDAKYDPSKFLPGLQIDQVGFLSDDEEQLKRSLWKDGPLTAEIDAIDMKQYKGGVLEPKDCKKSPRNHLVLLVGYGKTGPVDEFWTAKNSWGELWGEGGYFRIKKNVKACGINEKVHSITLKT